MGFSLQEVLVDTDFLGSHPRIELVRVSPALDEVFSILL
jgi:hypothetical protein